MEENDYLEQIALEEEHLQDLEEQARQDALLEEILAQQTTYQEEPQVDQNSKKSNSKSSRPTDNQMQSRAKGRVSEQRYQRKATEKVFGQSMQQNAKARMSDDNQKEKATKYARQTREENQPKNSNQQKGENSMPTNEKDEKDGKKLGNISPDDFANQMAKAENEGTIINVDEESINKIIEDVEELPPEFQEVIDGVGMTQIDTTTKVVEQIEPFDPNKQNQGQENGNTGSSTLEENEVIKSENFLRNNMKNGTYINRDKVDDINQQFWNEKESLMSKGFLEVNALKKATEHKEAALKKLCKDAEKYSPKELRQMQMSSSREGTKKEFYHCVKDKDGRAQLKQTTIGSKQTTYGQMRKQKKAQEKTHANKSSADMLKRGLPEKAMGLVGDAQSQAMTTFKISASALLLIIKAINTIRQDAKYKHIENKIRDAIEIGEMDDDFLDITANDIQDIVEKKPEQNGLTTSPKENERLKEEPTNEEEEVTEPTNEELEEKTEEGKEVPGEETQEELIQEEKPVNEGITQAYGRINPQPEPEEKKSLSSEFSKTVNSKDIDQDGVNDEVEKKQATFDLIPDESNNLDEFQY